jgi:hypothetical protein
MLEQQEKSIDQRLMLRTDRDFTDRIREIHQESGQLTIWH